MRKEGAGTTRHQGTFRNHQEKEGGPPPGNQEGPWRGPTLGRARRPPGCLVGPLGSPLLLYFPLGVETPNTEPFFAKPGRSGPVGVIFSPFGGKRTFSPGWCH